MPTRKSKLSYHQQQVVDAMRENRLRLIQKFIWWDYQRMDAPDEWVHRCAPKGPTVNALIKIGVLVPGPKYKHTFDNRTYNTQTYVLAPEYMEVV